jgi:hypothetical protein
VALPDGQKAAQPIYAAQPERIFASWRSPTLGRLLGNEYAEGFVEEVYNKYAELITTSKPECG